MGISGFQKWLEKRYPHCFIPVPDPPRRVPGERPPPGPKDYFDHIYVDLNGLIHTVGRRARNEDHLFTLLYRELDNIFKVCVACQTIFLAIDGPASAAKLITQRKRRLAAVSREQRLLEREKLAAQASAEPPPTEVEVAESATPTTPIEADPAPKSQRSKKSRDTPRFNTVQVTAGTPFMMRLKNALCVWACTRLQNDPRYHFTRIYISGPDVPGEGEIKIMEFISTHANSDSVPPLQPHERQVAYQNGFAEPERNPEKFRKDTHLIVGTDADLILLGLCTMLQNVFILTTKIGKQIKNIFSIWELTRVMEQLSPIPGQCYRTRLDFVMISFIQGNDYLPKMRGVSLDRMWMSYQKLKSQPNGHHQFLVNADYTLNVPFFLAITLGGRNARLPPPPAATASSTPSSSATSSSMGVPASGSQPAYPPALSSLFQSAAQLVSAQPPHHPPAHLGYGYAKLEAFVDPAIISSSAMMPIAPPLQYYDPSIIAASASMPYLVHPTALPPIGFDPYLAAMTSMPMAIPVQKHSAAESPAGVVQPPAHSGDDADDEVICLQPAQPAVQTGVRLQPDAEERAQEGTNPGNVHQSEQLIEEAIHEEFDDEEDDEMIDGDTAPDVTKADEEERSCPDESEGNAEDDSESEEEEEDEEEFVKGLLPGCDVKSYIQGLFWCLKMYIEGMCPDNKWFYRHRYAPTAYEVRNYFNEIGERGLYRVPIPNSRTLPLPPHAFCLTVLPLQAREVAHDVLKPYMSLDSKLGSIYLEPTLLVDVQLIESVLAELPESSLPPDLRFAHAHYYQRAPNAPYGEKGWFPHAGAYRHQNYQHPPGPSVLELLPQLPEGYTLWDGGKRIKCAYYPTRCYPLAWLSTPLSAVSTRWPQVLHDSTEFDYLRLHYFKPFLFLTAGFAGRRGGAADRGRPSARAREGPAPYDRGQPSAAPIDQENGNRSRSDYSNRYRERPSRDSDRRRGRNNATRAHAPPGGPSPVFAVTPQDWLSGASVGGDGRTSEDREQPKGRFVPQWFNPAAPPRENDPAPVFTIVPKEPHAGVNDGLGNPHQENGRGRGGRGRGGGWREGRGRGRGRGRGPSASYEEAGPQSHRGGAASPGHYKPRAQQTYRPVSRPAQPTDSAPAATEQ